MLFCLLFLLLIVVQCKVAALRDRIIGGDDGSIVEYPYQISLHYRGSHICGGAIIQHSVVITAAHCLLGLHKEQLTVLAGSTFAARGLGDKHHVENYRIHERYKDEFIDYDIGIIKILGQFKYGILMQPIPVADANYNLPTGALATVTGWGFTQEEDGVIVNTLRVAKIPILGQKLCRQLYQEIGTVTNNMLCAGVGGRDACQGDSGGPLVYRGKLVGLVSWGYGCARPNYPGVYTNVAHFCTWLRTATVAMAT